MTNPMDWLSRTAAGRAVMAAARAEQGDARQQLAAEVLELEKKRELEHNRLRPAVEKTAQRLQAAEAELAHARQDAVIAENAHTSTVGSIESRLRDLRKELRNTTAPEARTQIEAIRTEMNELLSSANLAAARHAVAARTDLGHDLNAWAKADLAINRVRAQVERSINRARDQVDLLYEAPETDLTARIETIRSAMRRGVDAALAAFP
jgi:hypothetical protein